MENQIQVFSHELFGEIRTVSMPDGQVAFIGRDIASVLGYAKPQNALAMHVDDEDKTTALIQGTGSNYKSQTTLINESGMYSLILSSKLPQAKEFKHWVTSVVLPQIRKTGGYIPIKEEDDEKTILCKALSIMKRTVEQKDKLLEEQKPLVHFANAITSSEGSILIGEMAKILNQNGFKTGQKRFFRWLREHGYIFQHSTQPIQKWVEEGIFELHASVINTDHGDRETLTTKVTGKGQRYFINLLTPSPSVPKPDCKEGATEES